MIMNKVMIYNIYYEMVWWGKYVLERIEILMITNKVMIYYIHYEMVWREKYVLTTMIELGIEI